MLPFPTLKPRPFYAFSFILNNHHLQSISPHQSPDAMSLSAPMAFKCLFSPRCRFSPLVNTYTKTLQAISSHLGPFRRPALPLRKPPRRPIFTLPLLHRPNQSSAGVEEHPLPPLSSRPRFLNVNSTCTWSSFDAQLIVPRILFLFLSFGFFRTTREVVLLSFCESWS